MSQPLASRSRIIKQSQTTIDWFKKFDPEVEKHVRKISVNESRKLKKLVKRYEEFLAKQEPPLVLAEGVYDDARLCIKNGEFSAKDIANFSIALSKFQDIKMFGYMTGPFLSALVNRCKDRNITIITSHLSHPLHRLGAGNAKNTVIEGDVGSGLGFYMKNGTVTVKGSVGRDIGWNMTGGTLHLDADTIDVSRSIEGGNIYLGGRCFVKNGKVVA